MLNLLHGTCELTQAVSNHLRYNFDADEVLAVVDGDSEVDHLWENDHVTAVGTNHYVFPLLGLLPGSSELDEELLLSWRKTPLEGPSSPGRKEFDERVHVHLD